MSQVAATLLLAVFGLVWLAICIAGLIDLFRNRRRVHSPPTDDDSSDLIDDLAQLDELHQRGILSHEELVTAKRDRRRQPG